MSKKVVSDLEKMKADRKRAEEEYLNSMNQRLEVQRLTQEGIVTRDELITYLREVIEEANHIEDAARLSNNTIVYCECIGIRREMRKLLSLIMLPEVQEETAEEQHRQNTDGGMSYV